LRHLEEHVAERQLLALDKAKEEKIAYGEIETEHVGYLCAQDTFYVGIIKGVGRVYQQTFIDTYSGVGFAKLYTTNQPITAADIVNDRVLPFFETYGIPVLRILTDRRADQHDYQLFLAINDIDHTRTKAKSPQTNGICERFNKTILEEFYMLAFRKKIYLTVDEVQQDLDKWLEYYNTDRPHQGKRQQGRTPMETFMANLGYAKEKISCMNDLEFVTEGELTVTT
jgi:transposase InsO family protein